MPQPPAAPANLAAAPPGTAFTPAPHRELEGFDASTSTMSPADRGQLTANPTARVTLTAKGFTLLTLAGDAVDIETGAGSAQFTAPNVYRAPVPGKSDIVTFLAGPKLTYATYGTWRQGPATTVPVRLSYTAGVLSYGLATSQTPTTGSATFTGTTAGYYFTAASSGRFSGNATLVADFAKGAIGGLMSNLAATSSYAVEMGRLNDINLTGGSITGAGFSGAAAAGGTASDSLIDITGAAGTFGGQFDGPNAAEVDGTYALSLDHAGVSIAGAFAATGQATAAGQTAPAAPFSPLPPAQPVPTLSAVPAGTTFATWGDALQFGSNPGFDGLAQYNSIATTTSGFTFTDGHGQVTAFDTRPGATDIVGSNAYFAPVQANSYVGRGGAAANYVRVALGAPLTYSNYGVWASTIDSDPVARSGFNSSSTVAAGAFAYGVGTPYSQVPSTGTATYTGSFQGVYARAAEILAAASMNAITSGDVTLKADFGASTIAGGITNIATLTPKGEVYRINDIGMSGTISASAYGGVHINGQANLLEGTAATTFNIGPNTGTFAGTFYGPNAAEVGGEVTLSNQGSTLLLRGAFTAKK